MCSTTSPARQGFTLVEVAVVLSIIGVIIGGVLAGQYLTRQAQLQSIGADLAKFKAAYFQFKSQYNGLPGDITDATSYWGQDTGPDCPTTTPVTYTPHQQTCNGDGNNQIGGMNEMFRAWQQLSDAGLIEGTFSGIVGTAGALDSVPGQNVPATKIPNSGYTIASIGPYSGDSSPTVYNLPFSEGLLAGLRESGAATYGPILTAREQYDLDLKMDDGKPSTGNLVSYKSSVNPTCTTSDVSGSAAYQPTSSGPVCTIFYIIEQ